MEPKNLTIDSNFTSNYFNNNLDSKHIDDFYRIKVIYEGLKEVNKNYLIKLFNKIYDLLFRKFVIATENNDLIYVIKTVFDKYSNKQIISKLHKKPKEEILVSTIKKLYLNNLKNLIKIKPEFKSTISIAVNHLISKDKISYKEITYIVNNVVKKLNEIDLNNNKLKELKKIENLIAIDESRLYEEFDKYIDFTIRKEEEYIEKKFFHKLLPSEILGLNLLNKSVENKTLDKTEIDHLEAFLKFAKNNKGFIKKINHLIKEGKIKDYSREAKLISSIQDGSWNNTLFHIIKLAKNFEYPLIFSLKCYSFYMKDLESSTNYLLKKSINENASIDFETTRNFLINIDTNTTLRAFMQSDLESTLTLGLAEGEISKEIADFFRNNYKFIIANRVRCYSIERFKIPEFEVNKLLTKNIQDKLNLDTKTEKLLKDFVPEIDISNGNYISGEETENLVLISKLISRDISINDLNEYEKSNLILFFNKSIDNKELNTRLGKLLSCKVINFGVDINAINLIHTLTFKTRNFNKFITLTEKLENTWENIRNNSVQEKDKFTLEEYGTLNQLKELLPIFDKLEGLKIFGEGSVLGVLYSQAKKVDKLITEIDLEFHRQAITQYNNGDILVNRARDMYKYKNQQLPHETSLLVKYVADYNHGAKIVIDDEDEQVKLSHIVGNYSLSLMGGLAEASYSDVYRLDVSTLVNRNLVALLERIYGKNWKEKLQEKYQDIEHKIHTKKAKKFARFENDTQKRYRVGYSKFQPFGYTKFTRRDLNKIRQRLLEKDSDEAIRKGNKMICSEFVTLSNILALLEFKEELLHDLKDFIENDNEYLKDDKSKKMFLREIEKDNFFAIPYSAYEKFSKIDPGRMIKLLLEKNCIIKVQKPPLLFQLIKPI